jgi:hypothetical protein
MWRGKAPLLYSRYKIKIKVMIKTIENAIQRVNASYPSIYSKDDVTNLLYELISDLDTEINDIVETRQPKSNVNFDDLRSKLHDAIEQKLNRMDSSDIVDYDSAEFNINYNNVVEIDSVNINVDTIVDEVDDIIRDVFEVFEETVSTEPTTEAN